MTLGNLFQGLGPGEAAILGAIIGSIGTLVVNFLLHIYRTRKRRSGLRILLRAEINQNLDIVEKLDDVNNAKNLPPSSVLPTAVFETVINDIRLFGEDDITSITEFYNIVHTLRAQIGRGDITGIKENISRIQEIGEFVDDW